MANYSTVNVRIESELKNEVEGILKQLGMTPSSLIQMLYCQIKLTKKVPLNLELRSPVRCIEDMTDDEVRSEIQAAIDGVKRGDTVSNDDVKKYLKDKYGI